jgi:hypothetical protein
VVVEAVPATQPPRRRWVQHRLAASSPGVHDVCGADADVRTAPADDSDENDERQRLEIMALQFMYLDCFQELPDAKLAWKIMRRRVRILVLPDSENRQYVCVALEVVWPRDYPTNATSLPVVDVRNLSPDMVPALPQRRAIAAPPLVAMESSLPSSSSAPSSFDVSAAVRGVQWLAGFKKRRLAVGHRDLTDGELAELRRELAAKLTLLRQEEHAEELTFQLVLQCEDFLVRHNKRGDMRSVRRARCSRCCPFALICCSPATFSVKRLRHMATACRASTRTCATKTADGDRIGSSCSSTFRGRQYDTHEIYVRFYSGSVVCLSMQQERVLRQLEAATTVAVHKCELEIAHVRQIIRARAQLRSLYWVCMYYFRIYGGGVWVFWDWCFAVGMVADITT